MTDMATSLGIDALPISSFIGQGTFVVLVNQ